MHVKKKERERPNDAVRRRKLPDFDYYPRAKLFLRIGHMDKTLTPRTF